MARTWQDYGKKVQCLLTAFATTKYGCCWRGYLIFAADRKGINVTGSCRGGPLDGWYKGGMKVLSFIRLLAENVNCYLIFNLLYIYIYIDILLVLLEWN